jgi:hypothetical protein
MAAIMWCSYEDGIWSLEGVAMRRLTVRQRNMAGRLAIALMSGFGLLLIVFAVLYQDDAVSSEASVAVTTSPIGIATNATALPRNNVVHTPWEITP